MPNKPLRSWKKFSFFILSFIFLHGSFTTTTPAIAESGTPDRQTARVDEVLSGDTVRLQGGRVLTYAGVQSPALQSIIPLVRQYGNDALEFNRSLVQGKTIQLEWGPQIRDDQGHLLADVFLPDGAFVNLELLKSGHAKLKILAPNKKYSAEFRRAELEARRLKKGLWKEEPENPFIQSEYIGEKNTKVYYFPTSPELDRIPEANLVKFRSRVEAKAAGYRACFACTESDESAY